MRLSSELREKIESIPVDNDYKVSSLELKEMQRCMKYDAYKYRNKYYNCNGKEIKPNEKSKLLNYNKRRFENYYGRLCTFSVVDNYILLRRYQVFITCHYQQDWTYKALECERYLISKELDVAYFCLPNIMGYYGNKYNHSGKIRYRSNVHNTYDDYICIDRVLGKPNWISKYLNIRNLEGRIGDWTRFIRTNEPMFETVLKHSQWLTRIYLNLCRQFSYNRVVANRTIKMIIRAKTKPIEFFNDDSYSHFIRLCLDLNKQFDPSTIWLNWKDNNTKFEKEYKKKQDELEFKKNNERYQAFYVKEHKALIGYTKNYDKFRIDFLNSIKDFKEEADSMCHCVYRMGYYKEPNSWIFSIKDLATGKRLETCELVNNGKELKINQCYGYGDKFTEQHDSILNVMNLLIKQELTKMIKGA